MNRFGDHPPHIHRDIDRHHGNSVENVVKPLTIHKVFHVHRGQHG
jgi:hypothetical protein